MGVGGGGAGVRAGGGGAGVSCGRTYTRHRYHALPNGKNTQALSFGGFAPGLSYPRRPSNRTLAGDKTGRRGGGGQGTWASQKHSEAGYGRPVDRGVWTAKPVKRPRQQPAHPQYANYWAPLTRKRHTLPHPAQPRHTNRRAPRTRKRHQQEHRGRSGRQNAATRRNMRREERVTVQGPVKELQPDGMSHGGRGGLEQGPQ